MSLFSPLDNRYQKDLPLSLSEEALLDQQILVEKAWLLTLMDEKICPPLKEEFLDQAWMGIQFSEIAEIEKTTQHATRALVEALSNRLKKNSYHAQVDWVHVGLTSFDTVDTAYRLALKKYFKDDFTPLFEELCKELRRLAKQESKTPQVGRTHGQWAVPTFFGLSFAEAHERLYEIHARLQVSLDNLRGQASGAIGGYHASSLLVDNPLSLEKKFLKRVGLTPHLASLQILPPEDLMDLSQKIFQLGSVVAKVAEDLRHLARSEIFEVVESLGQGQVGSSTMPQKRNPWNLEHVCSLYKVLLSKLHLIEMDAVTEHQRDLTNSASGRFLNEYFCIFHLMAKRLTKVLQGLQVNRSKMLEHLEEASSSVYAEAFYVLATLQKIPHAHEVVREASRKAEKSGKKLDQVLLEDKILKESDLDIGKLSQRILSGSQKKLQAIMQTWPQEGL